MTFRDILPGTILPASDSTMYHLLKHLHVTCAAVSFTLFFLRGIWTLTDSRLMTQRWVRIVPHLIDTLLLGSAIALTFTIDQYPLTDTWLSAKVTALLVYISLGFIALKFGRTPIIRLSAWLCAQGVFIYIVAVAVSHDPLPILN